MLLETNYEKPLRHILWTMDLDAVFSVTNLPSKLMIIVLAITIGIGVGVHRLLSVSYNTFEPPLVHSRIPYVGHVIGMLIHGTKYFEVVK